MDYIPQGYPLWVTHTGDGEQFRLQHLVAWVVGSAGHLVPVVDSGKSLEQLHGPTHGYFVTVNEPDQVQVEYLLREFKELVKR